MPILPLLLIWTLLLLLLSATSSADRNDWYRESLVNIHFDNHSALLAQGQDVDEIIEMLRTVPVTMIQVSAQSNREATYPTEVGLNNPAANGYDVLGTFRTVADRLGLKLCVYMSVDRRPLDIAQHPEWSQIGADGKPSLNAEPIVCQRPTLEKDGYLYERFIPQIHEIIRKYNPDGFWFDGDYILTRPCWCDRCLREWKRETGLEAPRDQSSPDWQKWTAWHYRRYQEYRRLVAEAIHEASPKAMYTSNWSWAWEPDPVPEFADTLSGDAWSVGQVARTCLRWGAQSRTPWDIMSYQNPDARAFSGEYSLQSTLQEGAITLAHGGNWFAWTFGGGPITAHAIAVTRQMADFARERADVAGPSTSLAHIAVLDSETTWAQNLARTETPVSVARSLQEHRWFVDLVNEVTLRTNGVPYRVVVIPCGKAVAPETLAHLKAFAEAGGIVLVAGDGLAAHEAEGLEFLGFRSRRQLERNPCALEMSDRLFYGASSAAVEPGDATVLAAFEDGRPCLLSRDMGAGKVAYLAVGDLGYPDDGLLASALGLLGVGPSYDVQGAGNAAVLCTLRRKGERQVLHVCDLSARVRGVYSDVDTREYTDWNPSLRNVRVRVKVADAPRSVQGVPALTGAKAVHENGFLTVTLGALQTHAATVLDLPADSRIDLLPPGPVPSASPFHPESERGGVIFSDDFEALQPGAAPPRPWVPEVRGDTKLDVTTETSAGGTRCLRFLDTEDSSFWPFLHRSVAPFRKGRARLTYDLRVDAGATCLMEVRYEGKGPGPQVFVYGDGRVTVGGKELMRLEPGRWARYTVNFELGTRKPVYSLSIAPQGQEAETFADLPYATDWFYVCDSVYFVGSGQSAGTFYLDNVSFERFAPH